MNLCNQYVKSFLAFFISGILGTQLYSQNNIPFPNKAESQHGVFQITDTIAMNSSNPGFKQLIPDFINSIEKYSQVSVIRRTNAAITLVYSSHIKNLEGYNIRIEENHITIEASTPHGCFNGLQSLIQFICFSNKNNTRPYQIINDHPRYFWRGLLLDESRHFFGALNAKFRLIFSSFIEGEDLSVLDEVPVAITEADETSATGEYKISVSGGIDNNYSFVFDSGMLTIESVTGISNPVNNIEVFPNPATDIVSIIQDENKPYTLEVFNLNGEKDGTG